MSSTTAYSNDTISTSLTTKFNIDFTNPVQEEESSRNETKEANSIRSNNIVYLFSCTIKEGKEDESSAHDFNCMNETDKSVRIERFTLDFT